MSRTSFKWGIPVTFDEKHVVYVWIDALIQLYIRPRLSSHNDEKFKKYWPADVHLVGKEIVQISYHYLACHADGSRRTASQTGIWPWMANP